MTRLFKNASRQSSGPYGSRLLTVVLFGMLTVAVTSAGCGKSNPLGRKPVAGTVTVDAKPIEYGSISFSPEARSGTASGALIVNGAYAISAEKGLPPGKYLVRISASKPQPGAPTEGPSPPGIQLVAPQYNSRSTLTAEVAADTDAVFDFQTTSR